MTKKNAAKVAARVRQAKNGGKYEAHLRTAAGPSGPDGSSPKKPGRYSYAWEKLYVAVGTLASGTGTIQERLAAAWVHSLIRLGHSTPPHYLDGEDLAEYEAIYEAVTRTPGPEGSINTTCAAMSDEEAGHLAERVVSLYEAVAREYHVNNA